MIDFKACVKHLDNAFILGIHTYDVMPDGIVYILVISDTV